MMKGSSPIVNINKHFLNFFRNQLVRERTFLIVLITTLTTIWFRKGLILGSGESGLPFYNTVRLLQELKSSWSDVPLGAGVSISFPSYPLYAVITFFQQLNVPSYILQATLYWLIFVIGALAIFEISRLFKESSPLSRFSSVLFYIFNPIAHISILHRFQYPLIFFYSFMPLAFLIYFKGLKSNNFIYLIILNLVSLIFSFAFVGPAFLELFFGMLGFLSIFEFISTFRQKRDYFPLLYFSVFVCIFVLINSWFLIPLLTSVFVDLGSRGSVKYFNPSDNVATFKGISEQIASVLNVFRLFKPNDIPKDDTSWGWIYHTLPFILLSFFSIAAFIFGLFKKEKELLYKFLILVAFIVMFWMKGSLAPFGGVTLRIFEWFTFLHVFRNPFEKVGMLLPFAMAIPIGFGFVVIINALSSRLKLSKKLVAFLVLILAFPVYMFPTVTGLAFTGGPPPSNNMAIGQYVKVPDYYKDAREWLDEQSSSSSKQAGLFRVLVLPIDGEGMTYKWEYGYAGTELSNNLFNQSMISFNTSQGSLPEMIDIIKNTLNKFPDKIWILAQMLNVKYIMIRDDIDYVVRETVSPSLVLSSVETFLNQHFFPAAEFGKLKFFELKKAEFYPRIFTSTTSIFLTSATKNSLDLMPFSNPLDHDIFITTSGSEKDYSYLKLSNQVLVNGTRVKNLNVNTNNPIENLPFVSIYRNTPVYALVRLKEELESQLITPDNQLSYQVNLMGKRLSEANHSPDEISAVEEYSQLLKTISQEIYKEGAMDEGIASILINQRKAMDQIKKEAKDKAKIEQISKDLDQLLIGIGIKPIYPSEKEIITRLQVPRDSQYEILVPSENWEDYYLEHGISEVDIDGKTFKVGSNPQNKDRHTFSLGTYHLTAGLHEVSISQPTAVNLIAQKLPEELTLSSEDKKALVKSIPILPLNNNYTYRISFEYLEEKGNVPVITIHSDADFVDVNGEKIARFGIALTRSNYDFGWKKYSGNFTPFPSSKNHSVTIKILPYGDCKAVVQRPYRRYCEDNSFNQKFLRDSSTKIRNLKVEKVFSNPLMLRELGSRASHGIAPTVTFETINPAKYKVKVSNAQNPFFLVLSTTYDPRWNASYITSKESTLIEKISDSIPGDSVKNDAHLVVNGYANGWYIDKIGDYDMYLEYTPVRVATIGKKVSTLAVIFFAVSFFVRFVYVKYSNR